MEQQHQTASHFTDLGLSKELENKEFRNQFFRTEREIDIPAQIKTLRKLRGMRQAKLAECAGTQQSAISRLERSQEAKWELETLVKLAEALDARLSVIFEPYEDVIARYRVREAAVEASAAVESIDTKEQPEAAAPQSIFGFTPNENAAQWVAINHRTGDRRRRQLHGGLPSMGEGYGISSD